LEKNLSQRHFVHHNAHLDWPTIEPGPPLEYVYYSARTAQ
jgi:hypothetical protein